MAEVCDLSCLPRLSVPKSELLHDNQAIHVLFQNQPSQRPKHKKANPMVN